MFEFVRKHNRLLQVLLVLVIFPSFVFVGVQGYSQSSGATASSVATVGGKPISQAEFDAALRDQAERLRERMPNLDPKLLKSVQFRTEALDALLRTRVYAATAERLDLVAPDAQLSRIFQTDPQFEFLRRADGSVNSELLAAQGMSSEQFAQRLRQDLSTRQVVQGVTATVLAPTAVAAPALDALLQQRDVQVQRFDAAKYAPTIAPSDADVEAYYKAHGAEFRAPEQATIEYVVLGLDALTKEAQVTPEAVRKAYDDNLAKYTTPEERRASHILVKAEKSAPPAEIDKARQKATQLLAEVRKNPSSFAELARKNSDDPGSAVKGGDLDFFSRGAMVKPFEDSAYALKKGQISDLVQSDFGFHIIELTDVRGGDAKPFDAVKADIEAGLRKQAAQARFSQASTDFGNMVYEQSDSLKPVADRFGLALQTATRVTRAPGPAASGVLASQKFLDAVFAPDALRSKHNSEVVETAPNQLASGRVVTSTPARQLALAEVRDQVRQQLVTQQAAAAARKDGAARLAALKAAPTQVLTEPTTTVSRRDSQNLPGPVLLAVLRAPASTLPATIGVDLGAQGYAVARVLKVVPRAASAPESAQAEGQYAQAWADAEVQAYYASLKAAAKVEVHPKALQGDRTQDGDTP